MAAPSAKLAPAVIGGAAVLGLMWYFRSKGIQAKPERQVRAGAARPEVQSWLQPERNSKPLRHLQAPTSSSNPAVMLQVANAQVVNERDYPNLPKDYTKAEIYDANRHQSGGMGFRR